MPPKVTQDSGQETFHADIHTEPGFCAPTESSVATTQLHHHGCPRSYVFNYEYAKLGEHPRLFPRRTSKARAIPPIPESLLPRQQLAGLCPPPTAADQDDGSLLFRVPISTRGFGRILRRPEILRKSTNHIATGFISAAATGILLIPNTGTAFDHRTSAAISTSRRSRRPGHRPAVRLLDVYAPHARQHQRRL